MAGLWSTGARREQAEGPSSADITVNELFPAYYEFVKTYYLKNGKPTGEQANSLDAGRPLTELYGLARAKDFGPRSLLRRSATR